MKVKRIEYDSESGSAYVYFEEIKPGEATRQIVVPGGVVFDLAKDGRILGMEILNPSLTEGLTEEGVMRQFEQARIPVVGV